MQVVAREYTNECFEGVRRLLIQVYGADLTREVLEKHYLENGRTIFVAEDVYSGDLVGTAFVEVRADYIRPVRIAYITYVAVEEKCRRSGIGRRLFEAIERYAVKKGCGAIELTSANYRKGAHSFYRNIGFTIKETTVFIKEVAGQ